MTPRRFFYVLAGITGLLIVAAAVGYYYAAGSVTTRAESLKQHLADVQLADQKLAALSQLNTQYQKVLPDLPAVTNALPQTKQQSQIVLQLRQLASNIGLSLPSVNFQSTSGLPGATTQTAKEGDALSMPINFQMTGSYEQLQSFLTNVEKLNRYSNITALTINRDPSKPKSLSFNISMSVYVKP